MTLKVLTWNTAGRTKRIPDQWEYFKAERRRYRLSARNTARR